MFTGRAVAASPQPTAPPLPWAPCLDDHDTSRMLELFDLAASRPLTLAELQAGGVAMPGQALYELQLAGYRIARVYGRDDARRRVLLGYRLDRFGEPRVAADALAATEPAR